MSKQKNIEKFQWEKHVEYIINLDKNEENTFEFYVTEHLKMSALYWGICCLDCKKKRFFNLFTNFIFSTWTFIRFTKRKNFKFRFKM